MNTISLFADALPRPFFRRLVHAVQAVGRERMEGKGSYSTTFWVPVRAKPTNIVEECVTQLHTLVQPGPICVGMEWWLGRLEFGESLPFHTDRDRSLRKATGQIVHPLWSSILYLNRFPSSPTVVLDQILSPDGNSWIPPEATAARTMDVVPNQYVVFRGDLRHGVVHRAGERRQRGLRLTLLVNYWDRRPMAPNCQDYNGSVYRALHDQGASSAPAPRRPSSAA